MKASDIMTKDFDTIGPDATVKDVVRLFRQGKRGEGKVGVNSLLVIDEKNRLVGLIAMSHILKAIIPSYMDKGHLSGFAWDGLFESMCRKIEGRRVADLMEKKVITIPPEINILEAADVMMKNRVRRLPVVKGGKVVGIIYRKEMFYKIVDTMLEKEVC